MVKHTFFQSRKHVQLRPKFNNLIKEDLVDVVDGKIMVYVVKQNLQQS